MRVAVIARCLFITAFSLAGLVASGLTLAIEPQYVQLGPVNVTPTVKVKPAYIDNLFRSSQNEKETWALITTPKLEAWIQRGLDTYSLTYTLTDSRYSSLHDDDTTDHLLNLNIHHQFNVRNTLEIKGEYFDGHEQRGTGLAEGGFAQLIDEPIELQRRRFGGEYTYGTRASRGRLVLEAKTESIEYQNFREVSRYRDRNQDTVSGTFFWGVGPKTHALAEIRYIDTEYDRDADPANSLDSDEVDYLVGLSWDATSRLSGGARVGLSDRQYDSGLRDDTKRFMWEADITFAPKSYSVWNFETRRLNRETNGLGDAIDTREHRVSWKHRWSGFASTLVEILTASDDYDASSREDDRTWVEFEYNYAARRWFDVGVGFRHETRDSNQPGLDYDLNIYYIQGELSL